MKILLYLGSFLISSVVFGQQKVNQNPENKISTETISMFQSYVFDHRFVAPEDMPAGTYRIVVSFEIENKVISNVSIKNDPGYGLKKHIEKIVLSMPKAYPDLIEKLRTRRQGMKDYITVPVTINIKT